MGKQVLRNENLFFILSDILFAEQVSIERNNPVIVIFRHLLPLLPNLYFFYVMFDLLFLYVMFLSAIFGLSFICHSLLSSLIVIPVLSLIYCHVRACPGHRPHGFPGQAHTLSLSLPDLIRQSRNSPVKQGIHRHKAWPHDMHVESNALQ